MKILTRSDRNLQLSRRLDWRFLLPKPRLHCVAYVGPAQTTLASALQQFSEELKIFSTLEDTAPRLYESFFDLVVMAEPRLTELEQVQHWLAPRGYLYAEVQHAWDWRTERRLPLVTRGFPNLAEWQVALARLGFVDIRAHWHRPSFERAVQIIPMHDAEAMDFVFSRRSEDLVSLLKFATGRSLMKTAWLARWLQCVSLVACKPRQNETP